MIGGKYFDENDVLSYGANGNIVLGSRKIGKSHGNLIRAHARRIRRHEGMVWVRFKAEEAQTLVNSFGSEKWRGVWERFNLRQEQFKRYANRILYRDDERDVWHPLIRYVGLSEWHNQRDNDDPDERFLFFDEFIVPDHDLKCHRGNPGEHFIDLWQSFYRGKEKMPFLCAGNPELGTDWLTPYLGFDDQRTPERVRIYNTGEMVRDKCTADGGRCYLDRVAVLWTTNPDGQHDGGSASGKARGVPGGLLRRRNGHERLYAQLDLGAGFISIWYQDNNMIVDTVEIPGGKVFRTAPRNDGRTVGWSTSSRRLFGNLRLYWTCSRVYFANGDAYVRFMQTLPKLL